MPYCNKKQECATSAKIPTLNMFKPIISLSKITYQMWHDDTLSQGSKEQKEQGRGGGWTKFEKGGGLAIQGNLRKIRG